MVELWSPIVHGGYYAPGDLGQQSPITRVAGQPTTPKNSLLSDVYVAFDPFLHYDAAQVRAGHFPSWNPYDGNGQPYFGDEQTLILSPFTLPFYLLGFRLALIADALARLWILAFFTYLFLGRHRLGTLASAVGAAIFTYAGYHLVWLDYQTQISVSATLAVALWCVRVALDQRQDRSLERREKSIRLLALLGFTLAAAVMVYDGHPETLIFDLLLVAGYAVIAVGIECRSWRDRWRWLARLGGAALLAGGLAAFVLLPFAQYSGSGARPAKLRAEPAASVAGFLPDTVPMMAFPNLFGGPQFAYNDGAMWSRHPPQNNYAEVNGNAVGLLGLCLVPLGVAALWRRRRQPIAWFALSASVVGSVMLFTRTAGLWWHHLPLVGTAGLNRSQDVLLMGIAVLAALGVDWVVRRGSAAALPWMARWRVVAAVVLSFGAVSAVMLLAARHLRQLVSRLPGSTASTAVALHLVRQHIVGELAMAAGFAAAVGLVVLGRPRLVQGAGAVAMVVLAFASNGIIMQSYNPTVSAAVVYPRTPAVQALSTLIGSDEALFADNSFPGPPTNLWYGLHDVGSYDAVGFLWHDALYDKVFGVTLPQTEQMPACLEGLQLFGVQWVVGGNGLGSGGQAIGLSPNAIVGGVPAYRVPGASLVSVVGRAIRSTGGDERALQAVSSCSFRPDDTVVLGPAAFDAARAGSLSAPSGTSAGAATAHIVARTTSSLSVRVRSGRGGWLVIRQAFAPGWTATVGGTPATVQRADIAFQAVRIPPGTYVVRFAYHPASIEIGGLISAVSVVVTAGLLFVALRWRRQTRTRPAHQASGHRVRGLFPGRDVTTAS